MENPFSTFAEHMKELRDDVVKIRDKQLEELEKINPAGAFCKRLNIATTGCTIPALSRKIHLRISFPGEGL